VADALLGTHIVEARDSEPLDELAAGLERRRRLDVLGRHDMVEDDYHLVGVPHVAHRAPERADEVHIDGDAGVDGDVYEVAWRHRRPARGPGQDLLDHGHPHSVFLLSPGTAARADDVA
jgi:hypothetical protein